MSGRTLRDTLAEALSRALLGLLWIYQKLVSPLLPPACRFQPTCSSFAVEAVKLHGPFTGSWLAARRVCRCHPFHEGGFDPVPLLSQRRTAAPTRDSLQNDKGPHADPAVDVDNSPRAP